MKRIFWCGAVCALLTVGVLLASGCNTQNQKAIIRTGTINSTVVLQQDDKYQELSRQYFAERVKASQEVQRIVKENSDANGVVSDKSIYDKLMKIQNDVESKWQKRTADYIDAKMKSMEEAAQKVAVDSKLDIILIDSDDVPTVEYGGHDVTANVLAAMPGFAGKSEAESTSAETAADSKQPVNNSK
ncbi:MAG: hypothetical protein ACI376_05845 [Candidatus Bruticola sp.]